MDVCGLLFVWHFCISLIDMSLWLDPRSKLTGKLYLREVVLWINLSVIYLTWQCVSVEDTVLHSYSKLQFTWSVSPFSSPCGRFWLFGKINFKYRLLSSPVYFQKHCLNPHDIYSLEVLWCRLGSHTRLHFPWYTTAYCFCLRLLVNLPTQHQEVFKELSSSFPKILQKGGFKRDFLQALVMRYRK